MSLRWVVLATVALTLALVVGIGIMAGATVADEGVSDELNNTTATEAPLYEDLSLAELQRSGTDMANSPPSVRLVDDQLYWMIHWPAQALGSSPGDPEDNGWQYLERGGTVERNEIYLRTINVGEPQEVTATIVMYDITEREVTEGNATTTELAPTNVEVYRTEIVLDRGFAIAEIDLPVSDTERHVTVWIEGHEDDLRWTFKHRSVATTAPIAIDNYGDYLWSAATDFLFPVVFGSLLMGFVTSRAITRAGRGPGWGYAKWTLLLSLIVGAVVLFLFSSTAQLVVNAPIVVSGIIVAFIGIVILETYTANVAQVGFLKPSLDHTTAPSGDDDLVDMIQANYSEEEVVKMPDNTLAVIRPGLLPFLARCFGGAARLQGSEDIDTAVNLQEAPIDRMYFVDPEADEPLEYEPEGWSLSMPTLDSRSDLLRLTIGSVIVIAASAGMALLAGAAVWGIGTGIILSLGLLARPVDGAARIEPAVGMKRKAFVSMMYLSATLDEAETWDQARKKIVEQQASSQREKERLIADADETFIQELFGTDGDLDPSLAPYLENGEGDVDGLAIAPEDEAVEDETEVTTDD